MKFALVTGGNSGIGYATARLLKLRGYMVTISGRDKVRVAKAANELAIDYIIADMGVPDDVASLAEHFASKPLHALVNNAALARFAPLTAYSTPDYDEIFYVNVRGPLELIKGVLPGLKLAKGSITNISSAIVNNGLPNAALYAATKGALEAATKSLSLEFAPLGVRINAVSPGAIDTPIISKLGIDEETQAAIKAQQEELIPLKRYGQSEEVAEVVVSQLESTYTTGAIWAVDGGVNAY